MSRTRSRIRPRREHGHNVPYALGDMMAKYLLLKHYRGGRPRRGLGADGPVDAGRGRRARAVHV